MMKDIERDNAIVRAHRETALVEEWKIIENDILAKKAALEQEDLERRETTEKQLKMNLVS